MNVRVGVIGCGRWGSHYLRTFDELPLSQVVAISDIDDKQLAQASQRHPQAAAFVEPEKVATSMDVDAVVVATPASTHYPLVAQALRAEKHVLVEKPFVLNIEEGQELVDLADQLGVTPSRITDLAAELSDAGLIRRERNPDDRRRMLVAITPRGRRELRRAVPKYRAGMRKTGLGGLTVAEASTLKRLLAKVDG